RKENWLKNGTLKYKVTDKETGIRSYKGTIDGAYAPFGLEIMTNRIICKLDPARVTRGKERTVEIVVTDYCGNETVVTDTFTW
ncbi:MAG: M23 family peptidase, partial [Bacteroides sp.]|nr:M23 family peptidase [Bacteroides sp.]